MARWSIAQTLQLWILFPVLKSMLHKNGTSRNSFQLALATCRCLAYRGRSKVEGVLILLIDPKTVKAPTSFTSNTSAYGRDNLVDLLPSTLYVSHHNQKVNISVSRMGCVPLPSGLLHITSQRSQVPKSCPAIPQMIDGDETKPPQF